MYICNLGNHLAALRLQLKSDLEKRFGKGALTRAAEQAFERWLSTAKENIRFEGDPVKAIDGILGDLKLNSVELQHSARRVWASKGSRNVTH